MQLFHERKSEAREKKETNKIAQLNTCSSIYDRLIQRKLMQLDIMLIDKDVDVPKRLGLAQGQGRF